MLLTVVMLIVNTQWGRSIFPLTLAQKFIILRIKYIYLYLILVFDRN